MKSILLAVALSLWSMPALAQARPERLPDKDVKALIDQVDEGRDKFEGNLDGDFKGSTVAGPNGPTKVSVALQDYQDNTKKLKDRFASEYAASAEVATVLKQSNSIDRFMQGTGSTMKGRSEWDRQVANLKRLAAVYGATFPLPEGVTPAGSMTRKPRATPKPLRTRLIASRATSTNSKPSRNPRGTRPRRTSRWWKRTPMT